jgi:hypothetical protein
MKIDVQGMEWDGMDWIDLSQERDRWGGFCECADESSCSIKCREFLD